jgi:phosphotransferase system enzyme I (PtsP)
VTFRTLDVGGDKTMDAMGEAHEENPFLGLRSIRFSLARRDIFTQQIRAMLRAGAGGNIRIIFPMVSSVEEFETARDLVRSCAQELAEEDVEHNRGAKIGVMVEVPSAVELIEELAEAADLLSIGTNDLVQYTLGVDRTNSRVSSLYIPHHPAVLRALKRIADAARATSTKLAVCGDMAANPWYIPFLLGIGMREFSVAGDMIPKVREAISKVDVGAAEVLAANVLAQRRVADVAALLGLACKVEDRPGDGQTATL